MSKYFARVSVLVLALFGMVAGLSSVHAQFADPMQAQAVDPIVRKKLAEEKACMARPTGVARANCLADLADWWWSESVKYELGPYDPIAEIHRILGVAITQNPRDLDMFTNYTWMQFSVDINRIQDGKATDITFAVRDKINEYRQYYAGQFVYPFITVDEAMRFILPNGLGSKAMKLAYLDFAQTLQDEAKRLYPTVKDRLPVEEQKRVEFQLGVTDRALVRRRAQLEALP
jgi:hypothetical protein